MCATTPQVLAQLEATFTNFATSFSYSPDPITLTGDAGLIREKSHLLENVASALA